MVRREKADLLFLSQQLEKAELEKYELQKKLKEALAGGPSSAQKVCDAPGLGLGGERCLDRGLPNRCCTRVGSFLRPVPSLV